MKLGFDQQPRVLPDRPPVLYVTTVSDDLVVNIIKAIINASSGPRLNWNVARLLAWIYFLTQL